jgi:hypothetical protein
MSTAGAPPAMASASLAEAASGPQVVHVQDPYDLSSGRVVHLVRSQGSVGCSKGLTFVHSLHFSWYTVPVLYNSDTEEFSPLVQPAMPHFQVVGICCATCCSRSVLRSLKPGT